MSLKLNPKKVLDEIDQQIKQIESHMDDIEEDQLNSSFGVYLSNAKDELISLKEKLVKEYVDNERRDEDKLGLVRNDIGTS